MAFGISAAAWAGIGAVAGAGASLYGANRAASANRDATQAATAANQANLQLAREQRSQNQALYRPELARGARADAFRDAITYGSGRYRSSPSGSGAASGDLYGDAYGGGESAAERWANERFAGGDALAPTRARFAAMGPGNAAAFGGDYDAWLSQTLANNGISADDLAAAGFTGSGGGDLYGAYGEGPVIEGEYTDVTQADIDGLIRNQFGWRQGDEDFAYNEDLSNAQYGDDLYGLGQARGEGDALAFGRFGTANNLATGEFDTAYGLAGDRRGELDAYAGYGLDASDFRTREGYEAAMRQAAESEAALRDAYGQGRSTVYGGAGNRFNRTLGYLTEDLAERRSYTDGAIGDRSRLNEIYQGQAQDRIAGMLGATGQIGRASRAAAERANQLNLEFAGTVRDWRNQDYDPYSDGRLNADRYRAGEESSADQAYSSGLASAAQQAAAARAAAVEQQNAERRANMLTFNNQVYGNAGGYYDDVSGAYGDLYDAYGENADDLYDDLGANSAGYWAGYGTAGNNRTGRAASNYGALSAARTGAYNDWYAGVQDDSARGRTARNAIAGFNGDFTNAATTANNANANAQMQGAQNSANIWTSAAGNIAGAVGDATAAWRRRRNPYGTNTQAGDPPFTI